MVPPAPAGPARGPWPAARTTNAVNDPGPAPDEAQLLRRIAARDRDAFSQLYDSYVGVLYATVFRVLNNPDEASDVLQEVFVQLWEKAPAYDPALGKPFNWAMTMARHKAIDRLRALKRRFEFVAEITVEHEEMAHDPGVGPGEVFTQEQAAQVRSAVATLPYEQRQAIEMAFLGGLTQNEIADTLRQPLGTIKARIRRGMLKLRDSLRPLL
jgi:RNA polymerase sigma-70 factor (ECF subfamily)